MSSVLLHAASATEKRVEIRPPPHQRSAAPAPPPGDDAAEHLGFAKTGARLKAAVADGLCRRQELAWLRSLRTSQRATSLLAGAVGGNLRDEHAQPSPKVVAAKRTQPSEVVFQEVQPEIAKHVVMLVRRQRIANGLGDGVEERAFVGAYQLTPRARVAG